MPSLNKTHKYAIQFLHEQNKSVEDIAKELGLTKTQVQRFISTLQKTENKVAETKTTDKTKNLMIRQTSVKKNNGVSIMTEGAAQLLDEFVKSMPSNTRNTDSYIFRRPE